MLPGQEGVTGGWQRWKVHLHLGHKWGFAGPCTLREGALALSAKCLFWQQAGGFVGWSVNILPFP